MKQHCLFLLTILFLLLSYQVPNIAQIKAEKIEYRVGNLLDRHSNSYQFRVDDIEANIAPERPQNDFLWIFGDGGFSFETEPVHTFRNVADPDMIPLLVVTPIKDDEEDPYERLANPSSGFTYPPDFPSSRPNQKVLMKNHIRMMSNNSPRPGDTTVYILSYRNCGNTTFNFDTSNDSLLFTFPSGMKLRKVLDYFNETESIIGSASDSTIVWDLNMSLPMKPNEIRNIFVFLEADDNLTIGKSIETNFMWMPNDTASCFDPTPISYRKDVTNSHDPNYIENDMDSLFCDGNANLLTYTIHFKNEGTGPASDVILYNPIDTDLDMGSLQHIATSFDTVSSVTTVLDSMGRIAKWDLSGLNLRGTKEKGYGKEFTDEETKGWVSYTILTQDALECCSAIPSQVAIVFDCNEPIYTNTHFTNILCGDQSCANNEILLDTIFVNPQMVLESPLILGNPQVLTNEQKWYPNPEDMPNAYLADPTGVNPELHIDNDTLSDYAFLLGFDFIAIEPLINDGNCFRNIARQKINVICPDLNFRYEQIVNCDNPNLNEIKVWFTNEDSTLVSGLTWFDCSMGDSLSIDSLSNGLYQISAKDDLGCVYRDTVWVGPRLPIWVDLVVNPLSCELEARVSGDYKTPLSYQWSNNGNSINNTSASIRVSDYLIQNIDILVTDTDSCVVRDTLRLPNDTTNTCWATALNNGPAVLTFNLYPNPNNGQFNIQSNRFLGEGSQIIIYDTFGNQVYQSEASFEVLQELSLPFLNKGIYFVKIKLKEQYLTKKILIQ